MLTCKTDINISTFRLFISLNSSDFCLIIQECCISNKQLACGVKIVHMLCLTVTWATCCCSVSFNKRQHAWDPSGGKTNKFTASRREKVGHIPSCVSSLKCTAGWSTAKWCIRKSGFLSLNKLWSFILASGNPDKSAVVSFVSRLCSRKQFSSAQGQPVHVFLPGSHTTTTLRLFNCHLWLKEKGFISTQIKLSDQRYNLSA